MKTRIAIVGIILLIACQPLADKKETVQINFSKLFSLHTKLSEPNTGDWRAEYEETGQSIESYIDGNPTRPDSVRDKIYILPIGVFSATDLKQMENVRQYVEMFFGIKAHVAPPQSDTIISATHRRTHLGHEQLHTSHILYDILLPDIPDDAALYFAITQKDLYPKKGWNYVFGQSTLDKRVSVASTFWLDAGENKKLNQKRLLKTVTHEMGHNLSLKHCSRYACLMNGSNSLAEADKNPLWLCPNCLYKVCWNTRHNPEHRLQALANFFGSNGFTEEASFMKVTLEVGIGG